MSRYMQMKDHPTVSSAWHLRRMRGLGVRGDDVRVGWRNPLVRSDPVGHLEKMLTSTVVLGFTVIQPAGVMESEMSIDNA